jgi:DNA-binding transcriptional regulator YbjK
MLGIVAASPSSLPAAAARDHERPRGQGRRVALLEATLRVIARDGAAAASHRAVAAEAGTPLGSTTYHFATRDEMLVEALRHAARQDVGAIRERLRQLTAADAGHVDWTRELVDHLAGRLGPEGRTLLLARFQLQLEAVHRPELRAVYRDWTTAGLEFATTVLRAAGSPDPAADALVLVAALDGVALNQLILVEEGARSRVLDAVVTRLMERLTGRD